jgi:glucosyl-3-phosphoglycerate synthase
MSLISSGDQLAWAKKDRGQSICVCLPALNEEATIGSICEQIHTELCRGIELVDELLVIDCGSQDETVKQAEANGARVFQSAELAPQIAFGGKGEALWKSLGAAPNNTITVWLDSDVSNFDATWVVKLVRPLLEGQALMTKGSYRRPLTTDDGAPNEEGGRVTELLARPLINALWPSLAHLRQPLAGECASFTSLLRELPFLSGYSVELGVLVEFARRYGGDSIADVDLGIRRHRNRSLDELGRMSFEILHGAIRLLEVERRAPGLGVYSLLRQPQEAATVLHQVNVRRFERQATLGDASLLPGGRVVAANQ